MIFPRCNYRQALGAAALLTLAAGGCVRQTASSHYGRQLINGLRTAARAVVSGHEYDRADKAARDGDKAKEIAIYNRWRNHGFALEAVTYAPQLPPADLAEDEVADGAAIYGQVESPNDPRLRRATILFRRALRRDPYFDSIDPQKLNALGYFLADQGRGGQDYMLAERLTRRAVAMWDQAIAQMPAQFEGAADIRFNQAITRDSLAWALYRLQRYDEARVQQETVIKEVSVIPANQLVMQPKVLHYHLGTIYAALHRYDEARREFITEIRIDPKSADAAQALQQLPPATPPATPAPTVPTSPVLPVGNATHRSPSA